MFIKSLQQHIDCFNQLRQIAPQVQEAGDLLAAAIAGHHKLLICGNGGSAADAQHFAAELIGRFEQERSAWPAVALTTDSSILTAVGNDYGFKNIFARQVQGMGQSGDALIGISTSGNSDNVLQAVRQAGESGIYTVGLLGRDGGKLRSRVDSPIVVDEKNTARIQEAHIFILHYWAMLIEQRMNV